MSLVVWLPLNGDLHNQGLENITTTIQTAVINDNGKIGKCYSFNGSNQQLRMTFPSAVTSAIGSLSCWIKFNAFPASGGYMSVIKICDLGGYSKTLFGITMQGTNQIAVCINGTATNNIYTHSLSTGIWYHLCVVYNGTKIKIYLNGSVVLDKAAQTGSLTSVSSLHIGGSDNYYLNGFMNDVRYYNHALSPKEVEEIAKGLVLHYKLDDRYAEGTTNLLSVANSYSDPNALFPMQHSTDTSYGYYFGSYNVSNNKYTFSGYINNTSNESLALRLRGKKVGETGWTVISTSTYVNPGEYKYINVSVDISNSSTWQAILNPCIIGGKPRTEVTANPYIYYLQLEAKDHATPWALGGTTRTPTTIYDSSGYSNSGAIIGNLTAAAGSPRYGVATSKANGAYIRTIKRPAEITAKDAITVSVWVNFSTWSIPISCTEGGGWNFEEYGGGLRFPVYIASVGYKIAQSTVTSASLKNSWHMITGTMDKDNVKIYIDGQEKGTVATGSENGIGYASNYIFVGAEAAGNTVTPTSSSFAGKISDVRIYATAFTAAQVADLYRRSMVVDASGNISPRGLS